MPLDARRPTGGITVAYPLLDQGQTKVRSNARIFMLEILRSIPAFKSANRWSMLISPHRFYGVAGWFAPRFVAAAVFLSVLGIAFEFIGASAAATGGAAHIVFIHEPVAWVSLGVLMWMAFWGAVWLAFRFRLSKMLLFALAPTGALFAFLALWTGSLWGRPTWGTWWLWDARLTSELVLLVICVGIIGLHAVTVDVSRIDDVASLAAVAGVVVVPAVYCIMYWATAAKDSAFVGLTGRPVYDAAALLAMVLMTLSLWMYTLATSLVRVRMIILERERDADWIAIELRDGR